MIDLWTRCFWDEMLSRSFSTTFTLRIHELMQDTQVRGWNLKDFLSNYVIWNDKADNFAEFRLPKLMAPGIYNDKFSESLYVRLIKSDTFGQDFLLADQFA